MMLHDKVLTNRDKMVWVARTSCNTSRHWSDEYSSWNPRIVSGTLPCLSRIETLLYADSRVCAEIAGRFGRCGLGFLKKRYIENNEAAPINRTNMVCHTMLRQFLELFLESRQSENCFLIPLAIEIFHFVDLKVEVIKKLSFGFGNAFEKPRICIKRWSRSAFKEIE